MNQKTLKNAVFCCKGLGDGLISLILSHNLSLNGHSVETFHPFLAGMQEWFPQIPLNPLPSEEDLENALSHFDRIFIFYEKLPRMLHILQICQEKFKGKTIVLNPIATPLCDYPYWENGRFDGTKTIAENLHAFSSQVLKLPLTTRSNGIVIPPPYRHKKYPNRVAIHATSSRPGKNWPLEKFCKLSSYLSSLGFDPFFLFSKEEAREYKTMENAYIFESLNDLAGFVSESGWMVGNDSGIGHLASCLGLPTVTICRSAMGAAFWRPGWAPGSVLTPAPWIPNLKGMRLRDEMWQRWIGVPKVLKTFLNLKISFET